MKEQRPDAIRRSIQQAMLIFIENNTLYNLDDIAEIVNESIPFLQSILHNETTVIFSHQGEINLINLYKIVLDLIKTDVENENPQYS